jgi:hypothetical protein
LLKFGSDQPDNAGGDFVLQIKNVLKGAVEAISPKMRASRSFD